MVDTPPSRPSFPVTMEQTLMPRLLQTQQFCVDLSTDADVSEPLSPVVQIHPTACQTHTGVRLMLDTCSKCIQGFISEAMGAVNT